MIIDKSQDSATDFELGKLAYGEWKDGSIKLLINEDGDSHVVALPPPPKPRHGTTLWVRGRFPVPPVPPHVDWSTDESPSHPR